MHTAQEIGIDDFQAQRSPDGMYRTTPLAGLWTHTKGGFYHDGRFATLLDVVNHYNTFFGLGLTEQEKADLVEFLKSLPSADNKDWTDGWWNPSESGWGVSVLDQNDVFFNVLYLYDQDGKPVWYSVSAFPIGTNSSGYSIYQGDLYYTTGPEFGGPYNPQNVTYQKVGTLTFSPSTTDDAQLSYSVNGTNVSKQVERFIFH